MSRRAGRRRAEDASCAQNVEVGEADTGQVADEVGFSGTDRLGGAGAQGTS